MPIGELVVIPLQTDGDGTVRKFYATFDGVANAFCYVPLIDGVPSRDAGALNYKPSLVKLVGVTSTLLIPAGAYMRVLRIQSLPGSENRVYLSCAGAEAEIGLGFILEPDGDSITFGASGLPMPARSIYAITDADAPQEVTILGG